MNEIILLVWETQARNEVWREVSEEKLSGEISRLKGKGFRKIQYRQYEDPRDPSPEKNADLFRKDLSRYFKGSISREFQPPLDFIFSDQQMRKWTFNTRVHPLFYKQGLTN